MSLPSTLDDPVVAVNASHDGAESAVKALGKAGFDMAKVSVIGKGYRAETHALGFYTLGDRVRAWGVAGGFWGVVWRLLPGSAVFVMPPLGVVAAAGPITAALVAALETAAVVGGLSAVSAALAALGLPHDRAVRYEADIAANRFLVIVHGTQEDVEKAREILAAVAASPALPFHQPA
jgi:hypothetical protein